MERVLRVPCSHIEVLARLHRLTAGNRNFLVQRVQLLLVLREGPRLLRQIHRFIARSGYLVTCYIRRVQH